MFNIYKSAPNRILKVVIFDTCHPSLRAIKMKITFNKSKAMPVSSINTQSYILVQIKRILVLYKPNWYSRAAGSMVELKYSTIEERSTRQNGRMRSNLNLTIHSKQLSSVPKTLSSLPKQRAITAFNLSTMMWYQKTMHSKISRKPLLLVENQLNHRLHSLSNNPRRYLKFTEGCPHSLVRVIGCSMS